MTVCQNFRFEEHGFYCLGEQTAKVDRSHYNISLTHHKLIRNFKLFQYYKFSKFSDRLNACIVNIAMQIPRITYVSFGNTHNC